MAITESNYIELMKNCSKFNSRLTGERKTRSPVFDQQTGTMHRPSAYFWRKPEHRHPSTNPEYVCTYPPIPWKRAESSAPADAVEIKMFLHANPALQAAVDQQTVGPTSSNPMGNLESMMSGSAENTMDSISMDRRLAASLKREAYDDFEDEGDYLSDFGDDSDDQDFGTKKKRKKGEGAGPGRKAKKASGGGGTGGGGGGMGRRRDDPPEARTETPTGAEEKRHACNKCGARYKSRPGLSYHKAHVHGDGVATPAASFAKDKEPSTPKSNSNSGSTCSSPAIVPPPIIFSPSVDISDTCDFCNGTSLENKKTKRAEELVTCHDCGRSGHPTCLNFSDNMKISTSKFGWQCIECKSCAICGTSENDDQLLFCDDCDRGFHIYCLKPPLTKPPEDAWSCHLCIKVFGPSAAVHSKKDSKD